MAEDRWLEGTIDSDIVRIPYVSDALQGLIESQTAVQELSGVLKRAGVKATDPLTVGVFVETMTRLERQASAERKVILMTVLGTVQHFLQQAPGKVEDSHGEP